jgi:putative transposase
MKSISSNKSMSKKTYHYQIYPTKKQARVPTTWLGLCCNIYNAALQERRDAYRMTGVSLSHSHQCAELPGCKEVCPELAQVNSQVLQDAVKRVDRAFDDFFRRRAEGQKAGYPRFRSRFRYDSLTFKQYHNSFDVQSGKKHKGMLILSKIGQVKMVMHRPLGGTPKTAIVKRTPTDKWFVSISVEIGAPGEETQEREPDKKRSERWPASEEAVGIDVGLSTFAYLSTGEQIENPHFFRAEEAALARAQRKLSHAVKGSKKREHRRKDFIEQETCKLIKRFGFLAVEALTVRNMIKNPTLSKSIADAAWSAFTQTLLAKAEEAERTVVRVNPAYTSQTCSACGHRQPMPLSVRIYECPSCGLVIHRDHNGSNNILAEGLKAVGRHSRVIPEAPGL